MTNGGLEGWRQQGSEVCYRWELSESKVPAGICYRGSNTVPYVPTLTVGTRFKEAVSLRKQVTFINIEAFHVHSLFQGYIFWT